jgi:hypothetical protein
VADIENNYGQIILTIFREGEVLVCYGDFGSPFSFKKPSFIFVGIRG